MTTTLPSRLRSHGRLGLHLVATVALVCLLSRGAAAQDSDDDGLLPVAGSDSGTQMATPDDGASNGGGTNNEAVTAGPVLVAGESQGEIEPAEATIEFPTTPASIGLSTGAPAETATFVADPPTIATGASSAGSMLQGSGLLNLCEGLQMRFVPPQSASKRIALLVLAHDGPSLQSELSGASKPELIVPLGPATSIDLTKLAAITVKYAGLLPGYHATIVFVSVSTGDLHVSAVRAHTEGGPLEVLMD